jgi:hypothetical protein
VRFESRIGAHGIGDTDAADDQGCEPDQRQELRESARCFRSARARPGRLCGSTSRRRETPWLLDPGPSACRPDRPAVSCRHARRGCRSGSGRRPGAPSSLDQQARRKAEAFGDGIGLGLHRAGYVEDDIAEQDLITDLQAQRSKSSGAATAPYRAASGLPSGLQRIVRLGLERAVERIGAIDGLDLDQRLIGAVRRRRAIERRPVETETVPNPSRKPFSCPSPRGC